MSEEELSNAERLLSKVVKLRDEIRKDYEKAAREASSAASADILSENAVRTTKAANEWQELMGKAEHLVDRALDLLKDATK